MMDDKNHSIERYTVWERGISYWIAKPHHRYCGVFFFFFATKGLGKTEYNDTRNPSKMKMRLR
jgi:hypothetical protein